jgi:hypothetical protein
MQKYVTPQEFQGSIPALAAGKTGTPESITAVGVKGVDKVVVTGNFVANDTVTVNGTAFTAVAAAPVGNQFLIGVDLPTSLGALQTVLAASVIVGVAAATYAVTDVNTAITATRKGYGDNSTLASTHATVVVSQPAIGLGLAYVSLLTEHTQLKTAALNGDVYLNDGDESQKKSIAMFGTGTVNVKGANLPGVTLNFAMNGPDALVLQFLSGRWRLILNDGAVAS